MKGIFMKSLTNDVKLALFFFGLDSSNACQSTIKKAYRKKAIELHPDRGGDNENMKLVNKHYSVIEKFGFDNFSLEDLSFTDSAVVEKDWLYELNEGHPLFSATVPSFQTRESLLSEYFSMRADADLPSMNPRSDYEKNSRCFAVRDNSAYFQLDNRDYLVTWWYGAGEGVRVSEITNAGCRGKSVIQYTIQVTHWGSDWNDNSQIMSNLLRTLPDVDEKSWCWASTFNHLQTMIEGARTQHNQDNKEAISVAVTLFGVEFISNRCRFSREVGSSWECNINGTRLNIYRSESKAIDCVSPYRIFDRYKPITDMEVFKGKRKLSRQLLIRILVNGQFYKLKRNYRYTDDYAHDSAVGYMAGMITNPLAVAYEWITDSGSCDWMFFNSESNGLRFGFHSNDSSGLVIALDNDFPAVDLLPAGESVESFVNAVNHKKDLIAA